MEPDLQMAQKFLAALDPEGVFTFQTFDDDPIRKLRTFAKVFHGSLDEHKDNLAQLNADGAGIFVMVNKGDGIIHPGASTCRRAANVVQVRKFVLDLDGSPIEPVHAANPAPEILVESSLGKWHAYWQAIDCPLVVFKAAQIRLAAKFNGDPSVKDLPRVMRLPGFFHQKETPFMTNLVSINGVNHES